MSHDSIKGLISSFFKGDRKALSKLISYVEDGELEGENIIKEIFPYTGKAHRIGITGPPGAGKSTIIDCLATELVRRGKKVAVVAVDPSSPFTGGALLGDRCRMVNASKRGIFIRSLATRGSLGGLSLSTSFVADLLDAFGFDEVLIETIGIGQSELDIMNVSDTVIVVLVPESGDSIQAMKAGLMEIADIFTINKFDREGAEGFEIELKTILELSNQRKWVPPVVRSIAIEGRGIRELADEIERHWSFLRRSGILKERRKRRIRKEMENLLKGEIFKKILGEEDWEEQLEKWVDLIADGKETPYGAVVKILQKEKKL